MGHVPPGQVPRARPGADVQRRERRGAGEGRAVPLRDRRGSLGAAGETVAAWFLSSHGIRVLGSNVEVGDGEVDLVALDGHERVVIEVRTTTTRRDPIDAIDDVKRRRVRQLASRLGARRTDFIGVGVSDSGVDVHWVPRW